jgi:hypothetical protein
VRVAGRRPVEEADLQLTGYGDTHWRATFYAIGIAHSIVGGSTCEPTRWRAVRMTSWRTLGNIRR